MSLENSCGDHQLLMEEIRSKGSDLENVEKTGTQFLSSAKVHVHLYVQV